MKTYGDLLTRSKAIEGDMKALEQKNVRFEDKTSEEISQDIKKKRRV